MKLRKQIIGIVLAFIIFILFTVVQIIPVSEELTLQGRNMLCCVCIIIVLLVTEAFPFGITCFGGLALTYIMGCATPVSAIFSGYTNKTLFFVLASFGISQSLIVVPASKRLLLFLMKKFGKSINSLILGVMICVALLSSVISNVAACAMFIPIISQFLEIYDDPEAKKKTGRAFMIAVPVASMIGGMMTPAGSSLNILCISMLEKNFSRTVPFVQWMLFGIPLSAMLLPLAWFLFIHIYKPMPLSNVLIQDYIDKAKKTLPKKMTAKEIYVITILLLMLVLWIASSWIPALDITIVALIGLMMYFLPGKLQIMSWKTYTNCISLEAYFVFASMVCVGNMVSSTGLSAWIAGKVFPAVFPASLPIVIFFVVVLTFLLLVLIPVAPAVITMLAASLIAWCGTLGVNPIPVIIAFGLCTNNCYLLPLDTVPLLSYATGYYDMFDMPKSTLWIQLLFAVLCSVWVSLVSFLIF